MAPNLPDLEQISTLMISGCSVMPSLFTITDVEAINHRLLHVLYSAAPV